jgi:hypothetical protein
MLTSPELRRDGGRHQSIFRTYQTAPKDFAARVP